MRVGLAVSIAAHAAILGFGFLALPEAEPYAVEAIEALPVDLVRLSDATELRAGDRKAEPDAPPQPKPQAKAPEPEPQVVEEPAETPVKAAREPAPKPVRDVTQQPKPEAAEPPAPAEPEHVTALPRAARPAPDPAPQAPEPEAAKPDPEPLAVAPTPRQRPRPPRPVAPQPEVAKVERPERPKLTEPEPEEAFDPDDITALLDKQEPRGGGDPEPAREPQSFGTDDGAPEAPMTQSELAALQARLYQCWNPPIGVREAGDLQVTIGIYLGPDGQLSAQPRVVAAGGDALSRIAAESAMRAVQICAPYDFLPREKYAQWRAIEFTFNPREMLGG